MRTLLDTNILLRLVAPSDPHHEIVRMALRKMKTQGCEFCYLPQNLIEFWNVATRPSTARGGYGLSHMETDNRARLVERIFTLLPENPDIYTEWRQIVLAHLVSGVQVHDAKIVAAMRVHQIPQILTLNISDFARYSDITAIHPGKL